MLSQICRGCGLRDELCEEGSPCCQEEAKQRRLDREEAQAEQRWFDAATCENRRAAEAARLVAPAATTLGLALVDAEESEFELESATDVQLFLALTRLRRWTTALARHNDETKPAQPWRSDWLMGQELMLATLVSHEPLTPRVLGLLMKAVRETADVPRFGWGGGR